MSPWRRRGGEDTRRSRGWIFRTCLCLVSLGGFICACSKKSSDPLRTFRIDDRFRIELYASEPLLDGPVAMDFDTGGRAIVLEMPFFPSAASDSGRTKLLEDTNNDGRPDRASPVPRGSAIPMRLANWKEEHDRTRDPQGHRFVTTPRCHVQQELDARQVPALKTSILRSISDHGGSALIFPITENPEYPVLTEADHTTSTCGITYYSNRTVPDFERVLLTGEPAHNLVHCDLLVEGEMSFVARRAREESEFLASTDPWFRPVGFAVGPDASLYVVDYHAPVAGPTEILDVDPSDPAYLFRSSGKGRIYRIVPKALASGTRQSGADSGARALDRGLSAADFAACEPPPAKSPAEVFRFLGIRDFTGNRVELEQLISDPREPDDLQTVAVRALGGIPGDFPAVFLLRKWRAITTTPRTEGMEQLFREPARLRLLLAALEGEQIPLWCLDAEHRVRLLRGNDRLLAGRTRKLLEERDPLKSRMMSGYQEALEVEGDRQAGELVYRRLCSRCHTMRGGNNYGPDLWTVSSRPPRHIMLDVLLPNESIAPGREMYMIDLRGGGSVDGIIGKQTQTTLTLLHDEAQQETVLREDIQSILMSDSSAMPVDLASQIKVRDMADLLCFLTSR